MSTVTDTLAGEYGALTERCGLVDRSERGKLALTGTEAQEFLHGQVSNDIEALEPGRGCYAAFLTPKGKMLGDLRVLNLGDELFLDTERVSLQALFNMIRNYKLGRDVELHKRTVERGLLSLVGPGARAAAGADGLGSAEHDNAAGEIGGVPVRLVATAAGVDLICDAERTDDLKAALGPARGLRGRGRGRARGVRPPALRPRPRRLGDPAGGRAQRARRLLHQGLLRRPGDRRAPLLPRQAQPSPARAAAVGRRRDAATRCASASARSAGSAPPSSRPRSGRSASRSCAARRRRATRVTVGDSGVTATLVELPFRE